MAKTTTDWEHGVRRCGGCHDWLPLGEFGPNRAQPHGQDHKCRPCRRAYAREYMRTYLPEWRKRRKAVEGV